MILTALEIKNLAEYALGISIDESTLDTDMQDLNDYEFSLSKNVDVKGDDGVVINYGVVVRCDGCEGNECVPISEDK